MPSHTGQERRLRLQSVRPVTTSEAPSSMRPMATTASIDTCRTLVAPISQATPNSTARRPATVDASQRCRTGGRVVRGRGVPGGGAWSRPTPLGFNRPARRRKARPTAVLVADRPHGGAVARAGRATAGTRWAARAGLGVAGRWAPPLVAPTAGATAPRSPNGRRRRPCRLSTNRCACRAGPRRSVLAARRGRLGRAGSRPGMAWSTASRKSRPSERARAPMSSATFRNSSSLAT